MSDATELKQLYRDTVLDHSRAPRNFGALDDADLTGLGHNPLCGDKVTVYVGVDDGQIGRLNFEATGCAISMASASIMSEAMGGQSVDAAQQAAKAVLRQFSRENRDGPLSNMGAMEALGGVRAYPSRIKCATLPWKTLLATLEKQGEPATTE